MCDCEELEFEDFELMLNAIYKRSDAPVEEPVQAPLITVAPSKRKR